jgi:hypothetical protein
LVFHHLTQITPTRLKDAAKFDSLLAEHQWLASVWRNSQAIAYPNLVDRSHRHNAISNVMVHFKETVLRGGISVFLSVFNELATNARNCNGLFLPTMDHDEAFEARNAVRDATQWYTCSKGHSYAIGDCGQPNQTGRCQRHKTLVLWL